MLFFFLFSLIFIQFLYYRFFIASPYYDLTFIHFPSIFQRYFRFLETFCHGTLLQFSILLRSFSVLSFYVFYLSLLPHVHFFSTFPSCSFFTSSSFVSHFPFVFILLTFIFSGPFVLLIWADNIYGVNCING